MLGRLRFVFCVMLALIGWCSPGIVGEHPKTIEEGPFFLSGDEDYRRDGAITSVATCLAVANDLDALELWKEDRLKPARELKDHQLAEHLQVLDPNVRYEPGFGTLYMCAEIAGAWYARPQTDRKAADDGRLQHGAIVVDLRIPQLKSEGRGSIGSLPLMRILTTPFLLPKSFFGGIVIRNARIEGTLLFNNIQLSMPLAFVNVEFFGGNYSKIVFGREAPTADTALAIAFSQFDGSLLIARSKVFGHVRIIDSRFSESLVFEDVEQQSLDGRPISDFAKLEVDPPFMRVDASSFAQSLKIVRSTFGQLNVIGNDINNFSSVKSHFGHEMRIVENDIESLQINCSILAKKAIISFNHIDKDLFIVGDAINVDNRGEADLTCHDWWHGGKRIASDHLTQIKVASNRIGGGLGLSGFAPSTLDPSVRLASNRVGNGSHIILPAPHADGSPWEGFIDLQGSTYEGTISIKLDRSIESPSTKAEDEGGSDVYCPPISKTDFKGARVQMRAAHIRTLVWNLPPTCDYRWLGYGLTYDLWLPGSRASSKIKHYGKNGEEKDRLAFLAWRRTLGEYQSASLDAMSTYLSSKGSYIDSRDILLEAKGLNYAPACRPDSGLLACIKGVLLGPFLRLPEQQRSGTASAGEQTEDANREESDEVVADRPWPERIRDAVMVFLLSPGGYGAKPERALFWIALSAIVFFLIYVIYSHSLRRPLANVPCLKSLLPSREIAFQAIGSNPGGLSEYVQPRFERDDARAPKQVDDETEEQGATDGLLEDLINHWPDEEDWKDWEIGQRLHRIQTILLPRIEACQKEAAEPLLATLRLLRRKLERFGSTEKLGFSLFDGDKRPTRFTHWRYSIDTMVPFIDLHAYSNYYPELGFMRFVSVFQHVIGWWLMTVFVASAAIL